MVQYTVHTIGMYIQKSFKIRLCKSTSPEHVHSISNEARKTHVNNFANTVGKEAFLFILVYGSNIIIIHVKGHNNPLPPLPLLQKKNVW